MQLLVKWKSYIRCHQQLGPRRRQIVEVVALVSCRNSERLHVDLQAIKQQSFLDLSIDKTFYHNFEVINNQKIPKIL